MTVDLVNRDPEQLNVHVKCAFEDVLAEPDGVHSIDCIWKLSHGCYDFYKNCCYKLMTFFCGTCIAGCWGVQFAFSACHHIWYVTPCIRLFSIDCTAYQKIWGTTLNCCVAPFCEACGYFFSKIEIKKK